MNDSSFDTLDLDLKLIANLKSMGYETLRSVQALCIPPMVEGKDIIAQAKTGSGKTAAFGIGIAQKISFLSRHPQVLIVAPTRELVHQIANELRKIVRHIPNIKITTLYGGTPFKAQLHSLDHGANIVVATPGRLLQHIRHSSIDLSQIEMVILDEADRMLDMGFIDDITDIMQSLPTKRQCLLFSATIDDNTLKLSETFQNRPLHVKSDNERVDNIQEHFYLIEEPFSLEALIYILQELKSKQAILFCNTKEATKDLATTLNQRGIDALALHGDLEQYERDDILTQFSNESCSLLVATDLASRGLDIKGLQLVINYDFPQDISTYIHRIGRSGRNDSDALAVTIYSSSDDITPYKERDITYHQPPYPTIQGYTLEPKNVTLVIEGGKKDKLRPGDIVGSLIQGAKLDADAIGNIDIFSKRSYVAITKSQKYKAFEYLKKSPIKKRKFPVWILE